MKAPEAAGVLAEIGMLLEIVGGDPFRAKAYATAARRLEASGADLTRLAAEGRLTSLTGVGPGIAEVLRELVETGQSSLYNRLAADTPIGLYDLMRIKGLGPKRIRTLYAEAGIDSLDKLEEAALAGRLAALPGIGESTEKRIIQSVAFAREARGSRRLPAALEVADRLLEWLDTLGTVKRADVAGEVRRDLEVVSSVDLVAASAEPEAVLAAFRALSGAATTKSASPDTAEIQFRDGLRARLTCVTPARWATALLFATGSAEHVAQLQARAESLRLRLGEDGLWRGGKRVAARTEKAVYEALGLAYVEPELREGWGEVEAAAKGELPRLVEIGDLRGTFHCHTTYSDGRASVAEMGEAARERGWSYLGIADHSQTAGYAGGLPPAKVKAQQAEIDGWNRAHGGKGKKRFRLFKGVESDILPDGRLDYDDALLASFDYVVGSVHSAFNQGERAMTDRLLRAVSNPRLTMLGHATGRLLLRRGSYAVDVRKVIDAAAEHGVAVEINADPARLDVDWRNARYAAERGCLVPINPDAHSTLSLDHVQWGVRVARKGWLGPRNVLNAYELEEVEEIFAQRKQGRAP
ncbi:MAG TPA: helix-hairpin-helix domain-containing protein [Longimicrobiaceae bacterium]|nr:helix-hairpin-helix domain-containing protein [Longimicrobiaceae bacterium]